MPSMLTQTANKFTCLLLAAKKFISKIDRQEKCGWGEAEATHSAYTDPKQTAPEMNQPGGPTKLCGTTRYLLTNFFAWCREMFTLHYAQDGWLNSASSPAKSNKPVILTAVPLMATAKSTTLKGDYFRPWAKCVLYVINSQNTI